MPKLEISQGLFDAFAARAQAKGFPSAEAYLLWVLREIAQRLPESAKDIGHARVYTPEQDAIVKNRLRSLGYID